MRTLNSTTATTAHASLATPGYDRSGLTAGIVHFGVGDVARKMFTAFAKLRDAELSAWVAENVPFPNSMVHRITPVTTDTDRAVIAEEFGVEDVWPVVCEPFEQWVLEDHFSLGRPPFEAAGVQIVKDVEPYELMKLCSMPAIRGCAISATLPATATPTRWPRTPCSPGSFSTIWTTKPPHPPARARHRPRGFKHTLIERFSHEHVRDTLARLCTESSDRILQWMLPVVRINLEQGGEIRRSAAIVASWALDDLHRGGARAALESLKSRSQAARSPDLNEGNGKLYARHSPHHRFGPVASNDAPRRRSRRRGNQDGLQGRERRTQRFPRDGSSRPGSDRATGLSA